MITKVPLPIINYKHKGFGVFGGVVPPSWGFYARTQQGVSRFWWAPDFWGKTPEHIQLWPLPARRSEPHNQ